LEINMRTGIASLVSGTCDIAMCSRTVKQKEIDLAKKRGVVPLETEVAKDGLAVIVHPDNPVEKLTLKQLGDIFTRRITNWKELGGHDEEIVILSREVNSGTHVYFKEHVLSKSGVDGKAEFSSEALLLPSSQAIADEVAGNPAAIGYYGMGYISVKQKALAVARDEDAEYVEPTLANVMNGSYPISRPLFMYTNGEPKGQVKEFLAYILSEVGQQVVKDTDFVPLR
ncbi:MAG: PstS family phosphate ABC transporter substrate-binding protein, partial [Candidatus Omnitrophica bacterium]|nr:PstS family phosphate ABC transporter substrate-binding protein [Candidatus Omnitrophota bacterium]